LLEAKIICWGSIFVLPCSYPVPQLPLIVHCEKQITELTGLWTGLVEFVLKNHLQLHFSDCGAVSVELWSAFSNFYLPFFYSSIFAHLFIV